jgi:DNA-binding MarR family transcriptional regulator
MVFDELPITRVFSLIGGIQAKSRRLAERAIRPTGLTYPQYGVLIALAQGELVPQRTIAERLETDSNTVAVIVDSLEAKALVERIADPGDKRVRLIRMRAAGRKALAAANAAVEPLYRGLAKRFSAAELATAEAPLARLYSILKEAEGDLK